MTTNTDLYRAARDRLVAVISDYDKAVATFTWPQLTGAFNWAIKMLAWHEYRVARLSGISNMRHFTV